MSCQQAALVQEDPYVFTDTVCSNPGKLQHNNSQIITTKYVPLVRSSQQNNHQTVYGKQVVKRSLQNASATQVVNGIQQRSSPVPQQQLKQQKLMVVQSKTANKTVSTTSSPTTTTNRNSPAGNNFQKSLPKTIINPPLPPLVTSVNKSSSQIVKVSSQSFKVPQVFVQQPTQTQQQPEKLQQNVQYLMKANTQTNTTHSISNQNSQSSAAIVNSTPQNQNTFISHQEKQQQLKAQNPPSYANAVNNRVSIISSSPQLNFSGASKTFVLQNQQQHQLQSQKNQSNVIQQQVNNENIANHNFQHIKTNASISNGKILYTIPVNSSNPGINQEKVSNSNKSGKPSVGKRKNIVNEGLQETTKDGKIVILPIKTEKCFINGVQQTPTNIGQIPSSTYNYKKKRNHKSFSSSSQEQFTNNKIGNVVTASVSALTKEWHAPDSYIYDYIGPCSDNSIDSELSVCTQQHWFFSSNIHPGHLNFSTSSSSFSSDSSFRNCDTKQQQPSIKMLTRDQRLNIKKTNLRRQNMQYWSAQSLRCTKLAQQRLMTVAKILHKLNMTKDDLLIKQAKKCTVSTCHNEAILLTAFCFQHILNNKEQKLFHSCTAKFSDNSQCRIPVYDINHDLPLCREHAMKLDNYQKMLQEQKPKKLPRKKPKTSAIRPGKRNKKKKKFPTSSSSSSSSIPTTSNITSKSMFINHHSNIHSRDQDNQFIHQNSGDLLPLSANGTISGSSSQQSTHLTYKTDDTIVNKVVTSTDSIHHQFKTHISNQLPLNRQEISGNVPVTYKNHHVGSFTTCENSHESSEDTGVGGLSESELMDREWLEMNHQNKLLDQDMNHLLNHLPIGELEDIFEPQNEDQLESALEDFESQIETDPINYFMDVADEILLEEGEEEHSIDNVDHHSNHQYFSSASGNEMHQVLTAAAGLVTLQQQQQELRELVHT